MIWGENGTGKTSILEAVHVLSVGSSFRAHRKRSIVREGDSSFIVRGSFYHKNKKSSISTEFHKEGKQKIKIDGRLVPGRKELIGKNNVVVLSPEEQTITKGGPSHRRKYFDKLFSVISSEYIETLQAYSRILKQRNAAINAVKKNINHPGGVEVWNDQLVFYAIKLWSIRMSFLKEFKETIVSVVKRFDSNIVFDLRFVDKITSEQIFSQKLLENRLMEINKGTTTIGPHRDIFDFYWNDKNIRMFGSQGEHKTSLILLKLAETTFIKQKTNCYPILLLDDLFAKLDLGKSKNLVFFLEKLEPEFGESVQTIITTTDIVDIKKSGLFSLSKNFVTHKLEKQCNT